MVNRPEDHRNNEWSETRPHDEFLELCAISTTGELTDQERAKLDLHLEGCPECRRALKEFDAVASISAPQIAAELGANRWKEKALDLSLGSELDEKRNEEFSLDRVATEVANKGRELAFAHSNGRRRSQLNWNWMWVPLAASVVLMVALGIYSFEAGKRRGLDIAKIVPATPDTRLDALEQKISDAGHDDEILKSELASRDRTIAELRQQVSAQAKGLEEMKALQTSLTASAQLSEAEKQQFAQDKGNLSEKYEAAQASLQKTQMELDSIRQQRSQDELRSASLQTQIKDLSGELRDREQALNRADELLEHDRDIRDLMGARDLYIAEVYDVARDGATQKTYGRVFYTKGKSLVFYAYDLDQQGGIKTASTFQAWGRRGPDNEHALNLGVFFEDSAAKKRWVLKFDDPQKLAEIDAIFVTVEPNGGSHKPSGKPLLFAYLKIDPNHP
jgi:hypothetical protein